MPTRLPAGFGRLCKAALTAAVAHLLSPRRLSPVPAGLCALAAEPNAAPAPPQVGARAGAAVCVDANPHSLHPPLIPCRPAAARLWLYRRGGRCRCSWGRGARRWRGGRTSVGGRGAAAALPAAAAHAALGGGGVLLLLPGPALLHVQPAVQPADGDGAGPGCPPDAQGVGRHSLRPRCVPGQLAVGGPAARRPGPYCMPTGGVSAGGQVASTGCRPGGGRGRVARRRRAASDVAERGSGGCCHGPAKAHLTCGAHVRRAGKPRRLSLRFLREERARLERWREGCREQYQSGAAAADPKVRLLRFRARQAWRLARTVLVARVSPCLLPSCLGPAAPSRSSLLAAPARAPPAAPLVHPLSCRARLPTTCLARWAWGSASWRDTPPPASCTMARCSRWRTTATGQWSASTFGEQGITLGCAGLLGAPSPLVAAGSDSLFGWRRWVGPSRRARPLVECSGVRCAVTLHWTTHTAPGGRFVQPGAVARAHTCAPSRPPRAGSSLTGRSWVWSWCATQTSSHVTQPKTCPPPCCWGPPACCSTAAPSSTASRCARWPRHACCPRQRGCLQQQLQQQPQRQQQALHCQRRRLQAGFHRAARQSPARERRPRRLTAQHQQLTGSSSRRGRRMPRRLQRYAPLQYCSTGRERWAPGACRHCLQSFLSGGWKPSQAFAAGAASLAVPGAWLPRPLPSRSPSPTNSHPPRTQPLIRSPPPCP